MKFILSFFLLFILILVSCGNKNVTTNAQQGDSIVSDTVENSTQAGAYNSSFSYLGLEYNLSKINQSEFEELYAKHYKAYTPKKIEDFEKAKQLLGERTIWKEEEEEAGSHKIEKITFLNGETIQYDENFDDAYFIAYFPELDILQLEGVHASSIFYNLANGEKEDRIGDPNSTYLSPNEKLGITVFDNGQDVDNYFVNKKNEKSYTRLLAISPTLIKKNDFWTVRSGYWTDNNTFYAKAICYDLVDSAYYKLSIKPFKRELISDKYLIKNKKVGVFHKGQSIEGIKKSFEVQDIMLRKEGEYEPAFEIYNEGITLELQYDYDASKFTNKIRTIMIQNDKYTTDKLIGTGSSINELQKAYPDIKFSYSYIGGTFCAESATLGAIQFEFNEKDFINKARDLMAGDSVELSASDFKSSAMVESIRIY